MYGWRGTILRVDLTRGKIMKQPLEESVARDFIGGRGFNSKTLFDEIKPGIDPLGPENVLCLAPGPLSGTPLGMTSRVEVSALSPYSGILGDGNAGGAFAYRLKRAGFDQIVITGRAESPKYLWIDDEKVELRTLLTCGARRPGRPPTSLRRGMEKTSAWPASVRQGKTWCALPPPSLTSTPPLPEGAGLCGVPRT